MLSPTKQQLVEALALPGFENWRPRVDVPELHRPVARPEDLPGTGRIAAVMVLIYSDPAKSNSAENGSINSTLVLTKRHANLSKHASQISFPGGSQDEGENLLQTAIRETQEEIGVPANEIEVIGQLNPVYIPPSDFTVTPFVGWHSGQPRFVRSEEEVDQIIEAPLAHLLLPSTLIFGDIIHSTGESLRVPYYQFGNHKIWGATAIMLGEFIERLSRVGSTMD